MEFRGFEVDGVEVQTFPLKLRLAMRLDKKITSLILHTLSGKEGLDFANIMESDVTALIGNFATALDLIDDDEYMDIVLGLLSSTQVCVEKRKNPIQITNEDSLDKAFSGVSPLTVNKILLKVMEYNKFTPFEMAAKMGFSEFIQDLSGNQTPKTPILKPKKTKSPKK